MHRRALLSVLAAVPVAGCSARTRLGGTTTQSRFPPEDRLRIVSWADEELSVSFVITDEDGETLVDETRQVTSGEDFTFADALPRRGSVTLVIDVDGGTRFERTIYDYESVTIEIRDAETIEVTELAEI